MDFFLNGRRLQIFGLCRHELFPYVGFAMPSRMMRRDAVLLRHELNCNFVRCSHYPQTEAFFDACDELGLLAWEELPGWGLIGDAAWQDRAVRDVQEMVRRDRNHPSIVIWGVRINESPSNPPLFQRTKEAAKALDDSRPTSGAMNHDTTQGWFQDVFAYNDYYTTPRPPLPDVPYLISEAVGNLMGPHRPDRNIYRRAGDPALQAMQALYHAHVHDQAGKSHRYSGVVAWCAWDYGSPMASHNGVKCPGVMDVFRVPKLGASFYRAQLDPKIKPVIHPNFYWDFGPQTPQGPGTNAAIFSNCDRLQVWINDVPRANIRPERAKYPPSFVDLTWLAGGRPELRLEGYLGDKLVITRSFSSDEGQDQFLLQADDVEIIGDGIDATRLMFGRVDKYGSTRPFADKEVSFQLQGPGVIVGDNPFQLADSAGTGAVWIKSLPKSSGLIEITAIHSALGTKSVAIKVRPVSI